MGERNAWFCDHKDHLEGKVTAYRVFLMPGEPTPPRCKDHPDRRMIRQVNARYKGARK